ncbi:hypothetical protein [Adonisia turfae]|uniref:Uncharacterized protein n=1 Tax=Adonisia turfae CCMR0081 TaxID=2292702 RepID=A0A6M0RNU7_9CYAN|nr:hypothetical protein [Adonisia turfae]NEZ57560.1 hypothetical protein [Adonisia turfae CCMR0081]
MPLSVLFYDGIFLVHVDTFTQLEEEIRLDERVPSQVIVWLKGSPAPAYWSESLDARMGLAHR